MFMAPTAPATDTLALVVEAVSYAFQASRAAKANLDYAALNDSLEVAWSLNAPVEVYVPLTGDEAPYWASEAVDTTTPYCWDACNGITTVHRAGWCRVNPEHADFDCGCGEAHWDEDEDLAPVAPVPFAQEVRPDEPF